MTAANVHAMTGEIIGALHWVYQPTMGAAWSNWTYTGSFTGEPYIREIDTVDAIASMQNGMTMSQFRGLASGVRDRIRTYVRNYYDVSGGSKLDFSYIRQYVGTSSYGKTLYTGQKKDNYGLDVGSFAADLIIGLIPELSDPNVSQSRKDAIDYWLPKAANKMGWGTTKTAEISKEIRRERAPIKIETLLKAMYDKRVAGKSVNTTIRELI